jgi:hypothetical protein
MIHIATSQLKNILEVQLSGEDHLLELFIYLAKLFF